MSLIQFDHKTERRSLQHRYKELDTEVRKIAESAYGNEEATRARVTVIEQILGRPFLSRLRWLFTGKF